jgi:glycosyltransferase involved in cell wall biosynthesis
METERPCGSLAIPASWQLPAFTIREWRVRRTRFAIGIPVLNEGPRIRGQLERMQRLGLGALADLVIADGGSTDGALEARFLEANGVRTLLVKTGPGRLSAQLRMFFAYAISEGYEGLVIVDGNGKDGVEAIPAFVAALQDGWDYVQGSRYLPGGVERNTPLARKIGVRLLHAPLLSVASGFRYTDTTNGFRAVSSRLLLDEQLLPFRDVFDAYNLHYYLSLQAPRLGYRVKELAVSRVYPEKGEVPTKIRGARGGLLVLSELIRTVAGAYRPDRKR